MIHAYHMVAVSDTHISGGRCSMVLRRYGLSNEHNVEYWASEKQRRKLHIDDEHANGCFENSACAKDLSDAHWTSNMAKRLGVKWNMSFINGAVSSEHDGLNDLAMSSSSS